MIIRGSHAAIAALCVVTACKRSTSPASDHPQPAASQPPRSGPSRVQNDRGSNDAGELRLDGAARPLADASLDAVQARPAAGSGECDAAGCTTLAKGVGRPILLKGDATRLYWLAADAKDGGSGVQNLASIVSIAKAGGATETVASHVVHLNATDVDLAVSAGSVYWTELHGVYGVAGAGARPQAIGDREDSPVGVAADANRVLWLNFEGPCDEKRTCGAVVARSLQGGSVVTLAAKEYRPTSLLLDHGTAYWITTPMGALEGAVVRLPPDAGRPTTLATTSYGDGQGYWSGLIKEGNALYWYSDVELPGEPVGVYRLSLEDRKQAPHLVEPGKISQFTVKAGALYISRCLADAGRCDLSVRSLRTAASERLYSGSASGLLTDDKYLFWADPDRGTILRANLMIEKAEAGTTDSARPTESR